MLAQLIKNHLKLCQFVLLLLLFFWLDWVVKPIDGNILWRLPALLSSFPVAINDFVENLMFHWFLIDIYDSDIDEYEKSALIKEITRAFSRIVLFGIEFIREIILGGIETIVAFTDWDFVSDNEWLRWPALPWTAVASGVFILGYKLDGIKLSIFAGMATVYIAIFGQWIPSMETLSFVLVAAPISFILGLILGVLAYKNKTIETTLAPLLSIAQIMPHFSYLVPVVVFFGIGDHAGAIATIIFATPAMIRLTLLGLKKVSPEVLDAGMMSGCTSLQLLFKVLIPTARLDILIGVNQVIMQCLAMVVIASFIGAKGLGFNLLLSLNQLRIGEALELGVCIVLIAVVLDKLSLAWANKPRDYLSNLPFITRNKYSLLFGASLLITIGLAYVGTWFFTDVNYFYLIQTDQGITTKEFWQSGVDYMVDNWYAGLQSFNRTLIVDVLIPIKTAFLGMPVIATLVLIVGTGYIVGGIKSALIVCGFLLFIAFTDWWDRALITSYIAAITVIVSVIIGMLTGVLCVQKKLTTKIILLVCDTFQTFPSFIYLIPAIMLFGVTDTSVMIAVIIYALIPATRYTVEGLRSVPKSLIEAAQMSGATKLQCLIRVELPLAFPHIMLGINQTIIFALSMIIIGAMIGTDDLGQYILKSLSDKNGIGNGIMLGLCVAFIGLIFDHLIQTHAIKRKQELGLV